MAVPTVTAVDPNAGPCGTMVLITGTNFLQDCSQVVFGTYSCGLDYQVISDTQISAIVPNGTGTNVDVKVTTSGGTNSTSTEKFTFHGYVGGGNSIPTVGVCTPGTSAYYGGVGGDEVSIAGTGFTTARKVFFGTFEAADFTRNSSTSITATAPQGEGTVYIYVENDYGVSVDADTDNDFTYPVSVLPTVTSIAPANGFPGDSVVITGNNFSEAGGTGNDDADAVLFGTLYPSFIIVDDEHIRCDVPGNDTFIGGSVNVYVENKYGRSAAGASFYYGSAETMVPKTVATVGGVTLPKTPYEKWQVTTGNVTVDLVATYNGGPGIESVWHRIDNAAAVRAGGNTDSFTVSGEGSHKIEFWAVGLDGKKEPVNVGYVNIVASTAIAVSGTPIIGGVVFQWNRVNIVGVKYEVLLDTSNPPTTPFLTTPEISFTYKMVYGQPGVYIKVRAVTVDGTAFSYSTVQGPFTALGVDTDDLVDEAIEEAKLALSIVPPKIVTYLPIAPTDRLPIGATCVWTTNNKLYRYGALNCFVRMTSNSAPSGTASASTEYSSSYAAWKALNGTVGNGGLDMWISGNGTNQGWTVPEWIQYDFGAGVTKTAKQFAITTRTGSTNVATPKTFTFMGSNDASTWLGLLTVNNKTDWATRQGYKVAFDCSDNTTAYRYYRLEVTEGNLAAYVAISEWEISESATPEVGWSTLAYGWDVASGTLTADAIAANTITAGQIAAGAIGAEELAAESVFAKNIIVTDYENLIVNANSEADLTPLGLTSPVSITNANYEFRGVYGPTAYAYQGDYCRRLTGAGTGTTVFFEMGNTKAIPCKMGDQFRFTVKTRCHTAEASYGCRIGILGYDSSGTYVSGESTVSGYYGTASYGDLTVDFEVDHSDVVYVQVRIYFNGVVGNYGYFDNFYFRKKLTGTLIVDGSITANNIGAGEITADLLAVDSIYAKNVVIADYDNLVPNSNSEVTLPTGLTMPVSATDEMVEFRGVCDDDAHNGSKCRRVVGAGTGTASQLSLMKQIPIALDDEFQIEAWTKCSATQTSYGCRVYIVAVNAAGTGLVGYASSYNSTTTWTRQTYSKKFDSAFFTSYPTAVGVVARIIYNGTATTTFGYFDEILFRRKMKGSLLVEGTVTADSVVANISISAPTITGGSLTLTVVGSPTKTCTISGSSIVSDNGTDTCTIDGGTISGGKMTGTSITTTGNLGTYVNIANRGAGAASIDFWSSITDEVPASIFVQEVSSTQARFRAYGVQLDGMTHPYIDMLTTTTDYDSIMTLSAGGNANISIDNLDANSEGRVTLTADKIYLTGEISRVRTIAWPSGTTDNGIQIQDSYTSSNRWKIYFDSSNNRLYVYLVGGSTAKYVTLS